MMGWGGGMGWVMPLQWFGGIVVVVALVAAVIFLVRRRAGSGELQRRDEPRAQLDERFARGEIDEDEYFRRVSVLDSQPAPTRPGR